MARQRQSTALFEVMNRTKGEVPAESKLRTPSWWFKAKPADAPAPVNREIVASAPAHAQSSTVENDPTAGASLRGPLTPVHAPVVVHQTAISPVSHAHDMIRHNPREVSFRLSYPGAAVCAFAVMVALIGAYVLGQRFSRSNTVPVLTATTTEELRKLPAQPEVLDIAKASASETTPELIRTVVSSDNNAVQNPNKTWTEPKPPQTLMVQDKQRTIGLNYVITQSYPDETMARSARDLLIKNGIDCTIETNLPGWKIPYCVVGTLGFDKVYSSREFTQYVQTIQQISDKFASQARLRKFEPIAYKWRATR